MTFSGLVRERTQLQGIMLSLMLCKKTALSVRKRENGPHVHYEEVMRTKNGGQHARIAQTYVCRQLIVVNLLSFFCVVFREQNTEIRKIR